MTEPNQNAPLPVTLSAANSAHAVTRTLESTLAVAVRPALDQFFTNVEANPTVVNVGAQAQAVLPNLIAAVPAAEGVGLKNVFVVLQAAVDHALTTTLPTAVSVQAAPTVESAITTAPNTAD